MAQTLKRKLKNASKRLLRRIFELGQHFRFDILPRHFYSEIPDMRVLKRTTQWKSPRSFERIESEIEAQVKWVDECTRAYRGSLSQFAVHRAAVEMNGSDEGYGEVEADFLYCFIRARRPGKMVQIGCGVSTAVCLLAARDEGYSPRITCIEPYPTDFLNREAAAGRIELVAKKLEDAWIGCIGELGEGDLFFVDSSHTLAPAGEVNLIILEMLPRLAPGVYVHFHDIYFPYDYAPITLSSAIFFWHETALLYAFLLMNSEFEIAASFAMLYHRRLDDLAGFFPDMKPQAFDAGLSIGEGQFPSSIFLRRRVGGVEGGAAQPRH
jgi:predicted O-methyltransferase YrrM